MLLAVRALCRGRDDLLAIVNPRFAGIAGAARILDVETVCVDETDGGIDITGLRTICQAARQRGKRVRALYVAPDFSNPSGTMLDLQVRQALLRVAEDEDFLLLEDNAYGFTHEPSTALPTLKALDCGARVLYLGTFSKVCLPGVRVGFAVADQTVVDAAGCSRTLAQELAVIKTMVSVNTSAVSQAAVAGMLLMHGCSLRSVAEEKATLYRSNLGLLLDALNRHIRSAGAPLAAITWNTPAGGFFVSMRLPVVADDELLEISASEYEVLWTPMSRFYVDHGGDNQIRLSCSYLSPEMIEEGARRLAMFLKDARALGRAPPTLRAALGR
jgi:(S)-3,5-dihydroxyphenylglycine transaminase